MLKRIGVFLVCSWCVLGASSCVFQARGLEKIELAKRPGNGAITIVPVMYGPLISDCRDSGHVRTCEQSVSGYYPASYYFKWAWARGSLASPEPLLKPAMAAIRKLAEKNGYDYFDTTGSLQEQQVQLKQFTAIDPKRLVLVVLNDETSVPPREASCLSSLSLLLSAFTATLLPGYIDVFAHVKLITFDANGQARSFTPKKPVVVRMWVEAFLLIFKIVPSDTDPAEFSGSFDDGELYKANYQAVSDCLLQFETSGLLRQ